MKRGKQKQNHQPRRVGKVDEEIGRRIRALRIDRGISQQTLGDKLGVSFQQIQKYEKGVNRVSVVRAGQIVEALRTTLAQIVGTDASAEQYDGFAFDNESYKLARVFSELPDVLKPKLRNLINTIIENTKK